jgi:hypothetical protein
MLRVLERPKGEILLKAGHAKTEVGALPPAAEGARISGTDIKQQPTQSHGSFLCPLTTLGGTICALRSSGPTISGAGLRSYWLWRGIAGLTDFWAASGVFRQDGVVRQSLCCPALYRPPETA